MTCGCSTTSPFKNVVRWCGLAWVGTPLPVRWWKRLMYTETQADLRGCGCPVWTKLPWAGLKAGCTLARMMTKER